MKPLILAAILLIAFTTCACARGGFSSSGRGGFSSRSYSSRSYSSPRSYSAPSRSYRSYPAPRTTTIVTRRYYGGGYGYGGGYYHPMMYPGFGMGYGYSNGLMQGLIIGNLMHPQGTTVYSGGGYNGSALLYPNGMVVDPNGYQVGTYGNGQFTAMQGGMVAQPAPPPLEMYGPPTPAPWSVWDIVGLTLIAVLILLIIVAALVEV